MSFCFSSHLSCEIKRAAGEKQYSCRDFKVTGSNLECASLFIRFPFAFMFFNFKAVWNHTGEGTRILEKTNSLIGVGMQLIQIQLQGLSIYI